MQKRKTPIRCHAELTNIHQFQFMQPCRKWIPPIQNIISSSNMQHEYPPIQESEYHQFIVMHKTNIHQFPFMQPCRNEYHQFGARQRRDISRSQSAQSNEYPPAQFMQKRMSTSSRPSTGMSNSLAVFKAFQPAKQLPELHRRTDKASVRAHMLPP